MSDENKLVEFLNEREFYVTQCDNSNKLILCDAEAGDEVKAKQADFTFVCNNDGVEIELCDSGTYGVSDTETLYASYERNGKLWL